MQHVIVFVHISYILFQVTYFAINEFSGDLSVIHTLPQIGGLRFQLVITAQASVINSLIYRSCLKNIGLFYRMKGIPH